MGLERLVLSYHVFCCIPRFLSTDYRLPMQQERMDARQTARREMAIITAEILIRKALLLRVPRIAGLVIEFGDSVRVFRETKKDLLDSITSFALIELTCSSSITIANLSLKAPITSSDHICQRHFEKAACDYSAFIASEIVVHSPMQIF